MKRRQFLTLAGATVATPALWPSVARAQQPARIRRVGVFMNTDEGNKDGQTRFVAFRKGLQENGWTDGRNIRIDVRWGGADTARLKGYAAELVNLSPDVLLANANAQLAALSQATRTIPTVFVGVSDPVTPGYVASYARPGGNITGFTLFEASLGSKWLAILRDIAPATARVVLMANPETAPLRGRMFVPALEAAAATMGVESGFAEVRSTGDIEAAIARLGSRPHGGLIVSPESSIHRELIVQLAAQHKVTAIYPFRQFTTTGGLVSYGPDNTDIMRRSASYIDRILRGEKPAELPIQAPTKYELTINLKTAKALGLTIPEPFLLGADEVIE